MSQPSGGISPHQRPRIREITGIRIHQLTLPESLPFASKLIPDSPYSPLPSPSIETSLPQAGPSSPSLRRTLSGTTRSRKERRISTSTIPESPRDRSSSISLLPHHPPVRSTRPRAPTLAGEALEHAHESPGEEKHKELDLVEEDEEMGKKRNLARCFVVMKIPRPIQSTELSTSHTPAKTNGTTDSCASSPSSNSPPGSPLRRSSSRSSLGPKRSESSTQPIKAQASSSIKRPPMSRPPSAANARDMPLSRTLSSKSERRSRLTITTTPSSPPSRHSPKGGGLNVPFYISPVHHPSTHPRFMSLSPETDFASWVTIEESASHQVELEVWYDAGEGWKRMTEVGGVVNLEKLRRRETDTSVTDNTVEFTLSIDPKAVWYVPKTEIARGASEEDAQLDVKAKRTSVRGIVERSLRETRMKKGIGVGALHQLVNMQSVLLDTERALQEVRGRIDGLLLEDVDRRALRREVEERGDRCSWVKGKIEEVEKSTREVQAHITLRQQAIDERKSAMLQAQEREDLLHGQTLELHDEISSLDIERDGLLTSIHHYRTSHVQTLDLIFPILPLHGPSLLYSILGVPLPIPAGSKDTAPPLSLPPASIPEGTPKIDERTTAAALGYVAMVVNLLGNLGGPMGGLAYPITCAGSRSLVKDVVSVMQGPRSFPLYAKGVERYRYEYAVFLLNKNIEMLMQEANIRLLDLRHTLPNLKVLLLTLSSPEAPASSYMALSRSTTYVDSVASSRQTSAAWPRPYGSPGPSTLVTGSIGSPGSSKGSIGLRESPLKGHERRGGVRRSGLRRSLGGGGGGEDVEMSSDGDLEERTVGDEKSESGLGSP